MFIVDSLDAFRGGDEAHDPDVGDLLLLEDLDGAEDGAASGEHGVDDDDLTFSNIRRHVQIVLHGLEGLFIALDADVADLGDGDESDESVDHTESSAEDGDDAGLATDDVLGVALTHWGSDLVGLEGEVASQLETHEHGDFGEELAEVLGAGGGLADDAQLVLDEGMVKYYNLVHVGMKVTLRKGRSNIKLPVRVLVRRNMED